MIYLQVMYFQVQLMMSEYLLIYCFRSSLISTKSLPNNLQNMSLDFSTGIGDQYAIHDNLTVKWTHLSLINPWIPIGSSCQRSNPALIKSLAIMYT